jgi:ParB family chromosome partitioning protein
LTALAECEDRFRHLLPEQAEGLWDWLLAQEGATRLQLLAYCASLTVNAVTKAHDRRDEQLAHADRLAFALRLDMTRWWLPTGQNYLSRVSKARILEAVAEGVSASAAENLAKLKKDALVKLAEERLAGTGWLPAVLRPPATLAPEPEAETLAA